MLQITGKLTPLKEESIRATQSLWSTKSGLARSKSVSNDGEELETSVRDLSYLSKIFKYFTYSCYTVYSKC